MSIAYLSPSILTSFLAGIITFLAPCTFTILPSFLVYLTGKSFSEVENIKKEVFLHTLVFSLSFIITFSLVGLLINVAVSSLSYKLIHVLRLISAIFLFIFGISFLGLVRLPPFHFSNKHKVVKKINHIKKKNIITNYLGTFLLGLFFSLVWGGCVGPVLGAILSLAVAYPSKAFFLLLFYSLGMVFPLIVSAFFISSLSKYVLKISKHYRLLEILTGIIFILIALILAFNIQNKIYLLWNAFLG